MVCIDSLWAWPEGHAQDRSLLLSSDWHWSQGNLLLPWLISKGTSSHVAPAAEGIQHIPWYIGDDHLASLEAMTVALRRILCFPVLNLVTDLASEQVHSDHSPTSHNGACAQRTLELLTQLASFQVAIMDQALACFSFVFGWPGRCCLYPLVCYQVFSLLAGNCLPYLQSGVSLGNLCSEWIRILLNPRVSARRGATPFLACSLYGDSMSMGINGTVET